jgi:prepilin-type N-terminal cleavage/methylation domain-containing protein
MRKHKGFTLIELVVVVMILGILAAVAAPKLLNTSGTASDNACRESLGVIRDAVERYTAEHGGSLPPATDQTAFKGALVPQYIRAFPKCPVVNLNANVAIVASPTAPTGTEGWQYNSSDGTFIVNSAATTKADPGTTYNLW